MYYFFPGMTDYHLFEVPYHANEIKYAFIDYWQRGLIVLHRKSDYIRDWNENATLEVRLSEEDTMKFSNNDWIYIRIRLRLTDGREIKYEPFRLKNGFQSYREIYYREE